MFSYEPNGNKLIQFESNYSPKHTETAELKNETLFYHTFPRRDDYVFVIVTLDKLTHMMVTFQIKQMTSLVDQTKKYHTSAF